MNNKISNVITAVHLMVLTGFLFVSPMALAKEGDAHWTQRIEVSGVLEAEYASSEGFDGTKSSDIALATVELAFDAKIDKNISAHISFLYEENDTAYDVDEGYVDIKFGKMFVQAGQMYVPFGSYETNMVSDPLTLELGETQQSVVQLGVGMGDLQVSAYMFNGTTQEAGADDTADQMGARIKYLLEGKNSTIDVGIDYINNLDSGAVIGYLDTDPNITTDTELKAYVSAQVIYANLSFGNIHFIAEHLMTDQFDLTEVAFNSKGAEITATNIEVGYSMTVAGMESMVGVAMQSTDEAVALGLPKEKTLVALSMNVYKDTAFSFEYANSSDYAVADGGTGKDATSYTVQLAVGF